jgi:16S rRNA (guanine527-N7)-methyltransferase
VIAPNLDSLIEEAQRRGFVGPGPVAPHVKHAVELAAMLEPFGGRLLDLGSGGGLPGLVLATKFPLASVVLLDSQRRRCEFLEEAISALQLGNRCVVAHGRAEELAREPRRRQMFDLVTARLFGPPATTAECAVGFLAVGGSLVVTEPPLGSGRGGHGVSIRWPDEGLARLGLGPADLVQRGETTAARMTLTEPVSEQWPRRVGVPLKRPLWKA